MNEKEIARIIMEKWEKIDPDLEKSIEEYEKFFNEQYQQLVNLETPVVRAEILQKDLMGFFKVPALVSDFDKNLEVTADGFHTICVDPSHVFLVKSFLPSKSFLVYNLDEEGSVTLDFEKIVEFLRLFKNTSFVSVKVDEDKFKIKCNYITRGIGLKERVNKPNDLNLSYSYECEINLKDLYKGVKSLKLFDYIVFDGKNDELHLRAENDVDVADYPFFVDGKGEAVAMYDAELLEKILKNLTLKELDYETVVLRWSDDKPLTIIGDTTKKVLHTFYLAPRID